MKLEKKTGETTTAYGKKLDTPISFDYEWRSYETDEELVQAKDEMTLEEQRKARNDARQMSSRNKALTAALKAAGYEKPTLDSDEQLRLREMFKVLMSSKKYTEEAARELASTTLGIAWED